MHPIDGPSLNLEIADLRHLRVGALHVVRQPNGVPVGGTGGKVDGRGFNSRCNHIGESLRKIKRLTKYGHFFAGHFGAKLASRP